MAAPKESQLAVTLFTLRDYCTKPRRIARTLARVRKIGYRNVQISGGGLLAREPAELARMMADAGLRVIGSHIALAMMRDDFGGVVERLRAWKCSHTAIPWVAQEDRSTLAAWKARARELTHLGKALRKEGITLQYHNHHFEFHKFGGRGGLGGRTGLDILYSATAPEYLQAEIDIEHSTRLHVFELAVHSLVHIIAISDFDRAFCRSVRRKLKFIRRNFINELDIVAFTLRNGHLNLCLPLSESIERLGCFTRQWCIFIQNGTILNYSPACFLINRSANSAVTVIANVGQIYVHQAAGNSCRHNIGLFSEHCQSGV